MIWSCITSLPLPGLNSTEFLSETLWLASDSIVRSYLPEFRSSNTLISSVILAVNLILKINNKLVSIACNT